MAKFYSSCGDRGPRHACDGYVSTREILELAGRKPATPTARWGHEVQEVGPLHSTGETSNDRGGKGVDKLKEN